MNLDLFQLETIPAPPKIDPVPDGVQRPLFSVMMPVCNRTKYLRQALESVVHENYPPNQMQICIVDNSTETIDWESFFTPEETRRIEIFQQPKHVGVAENWNTCIAQSRGHFVHILHDDDWILPEFYDEIKNIASLDTGAGLLATRNVIVNSHDVWTDITPILNTTEKMFTNLEEGFYTNPFQCSGVVMRRSFYEKYGGFLMSLQYTVDWEMWIRAIQISGGVVSEKVLATYRVHDLSATSRLVRNAEDLQDLNRLSRLFARFATFDEKAFRSRTLAKAWHQRAVFRAQGDWEAARANEDFWRKNSSIRQKIARLLNAVARRIGD